MGSGALIRIRLGADGLGNVRIRFSPDIQAELTAAARPGAGRSQPPGLLGQLYARDIGPDLAGEISGEYFSHLFARRSPTPFTSALADGDERARAILADRVQHLRDATVERHRTRISAAVTALAARWSNTVSAHGASAMLNALGWGIRLRNGWLELPTPYEGDFELGDCPLLIQAVALDYRVSLAEVSDEGIAVRIPTGGLPPSRSACVPALTALLGSARAQSLQAIGDAGGLTGRQLAGVLGVSDATASRHVSVLRDAGLIRTVRFGQSVQHIATALGYQLMDNPERSSE